MSRLLLTSWPRVSLRSHLSRLINHCKSPRAPSAPRSPWTPTRGSPLLLSLGLLAPLKQCWPQVKAETLPSIPSDSSNSPTLASFKYSELWSLLKSHVWLLFLAISSALVAAILNIQIPRCLGSLIDVLSDLQTHQAGIEDFFGAMTQPAIRMLQLASTQALATFVYIYSLSCLGERVALELRNRLFSSLLQQEICFFDTHKTGEIVSRLNADVQDFKSSFKLCVSQGLRSIAQIAGCFVSLMSLSPQMTSLIVVVVPSVVALGSVFGSFLRSMSRRAQEQVGRACAVSEECISNIRTVRAFAMESHEKEDYANQLREAERLNVRLGLGIAFFQAGTNLFLNTLVLSTIYYGGYLMSSHQLRPGDIMAFLVATQTVQRSLTQLSLLFGNFIKGQSAGARVFEYINLRPSLAESVGGSVISSEELRGNVELRNVSFSYPSRSSQLILDNFSLAIPAGKTVALVGESGGGKSTVAALLERFYDPDQGDVYIDGVNIRDLDPFWLRGRLIGFINQEPVLFASSVRENIRYGRPEATDEEVEAAARAANAHAFIQQFPNGYETVLGERGVTVSGGQKQRIAIARALIKNPRILILDEATSALDTQSERIVQDALDEASHGRSVLVIAHRLSTVQNADLIAVVSKGRVAELGTHQELKKRKGLYAKLIQQQEIDSEVHRFQFNSGMHHRNAFDLFSESFWDDVIFIDGLVLS